MESVSYKEYCEYIGSMDIWHTRTVDEYKSDGYRVDVFTTETKSYGKVIAKSKQFADTPDKSEYYIDKNINWRIS